MFNCGGMRNKDINKELKIACNGEPCSKMPVQASEASVAA